MEGHHRPSKTKRPTPKNPTNAPFHPRTDANCVVYAHRARSTLRNASRRAGLTLWCPGSRNGSTARTASTGATQEQQRRGAPRTKRALSVEHLRRLGLGGKGLNLELVIQT